MTDEDRGEDRFEQDLHRLIKHADPLRGVELPALATRAEIRVLAAPDLLPAFLHIRDAERYWTGSSGRWTVCGLPWRDPDPGLALPPCPECGRLWSQLSDGSG